MTGNIPKSITDTIFCFFAALCGKARLVGLQYSWRGVYILIFICNHSGYATAYRKGTDMALQDVLTMSLFFHRHLAAKYGYTITVDKPGPPRVDCFQRIISSLQEDVALSDATFLEKVSSSAQYHTVAEKHKDLLLRDNIFEAILRAKRESGEYGSYEYSGYCDVCEQDVLLRMETMWTTHTEGMCCPKCGHNSRYRNI